MKKSFIKKIIEREGSVYTTKNYCYFRHIIEDYDQDGNYLGFHYFINRLHINFANAGLFQDDLFEDVFEGNI